MARIRTYNKIAPEGIAILEDRGHQVSSDTEDPDAILVRSAKLHDIEFGASLKAIARAGAGVNNVPVERCTDAGIVVFNTPGSNANSVKELVVAGLMLSSRKIIDGYTWTQTLDPSTTDVAKEVESGKSAFAGPEIAGKKLGVIGLGAIGVMVANIGEALEMEVIGYDPYLSVENAWGLSHAVRRAGSLEALIGEVDYVTLHAPLNDATKNLIGTDLLRRAKPGLRILNFARGGLVDDTAVLAAIEDGTVNRYVTDFPEGDLIGVDGVVTIPHLGASTPEAETNSAVMAARQLADYLERGNIRNGVNIPNCAMDGDGGDRIVFINRNVPNMVGQVTTILAEAGLNISDMINRHQGELAYNIIDIDSTVDSSVADTIRAINGIVRLRVIPVQEV
ncbi:MAG TPA: phosphoglycerate dehydrogenase [Alkalispirochaeta sp.]|nr:phosphoglycerate dehydrogenase [Alkalispirochaeta sp.]